MSKTFENATVIAPLQDVTNIIRDIIRQEINAKNEKELQEKFLSPKETCQLFTPSIALPTLARYVKNGLLIKHYLGSSTWFRYSEVIEAVKEIKRYSHNQDIINNRN